MRRVWMVPIAVVVVALWPAASGLTAQEAVTGSTVSLAAGAASLELALAGGESRIISLREGELLIDGEVQGTYEPGGALDSSWRSLLTSPALFEGSGLADRLAEWVPDTSGNADAASGSALESLFDRLAESSNRTALAALPETATITVSGSQVAIAPSRIMSLGGLTRGVELLGRQLEVLGGQVAGLEDNLALVVHDDYTVDADQLVEGSLALLSGDLSLEGTVDGDVLVLDGVLTLARSARVSGDILQVGGEVIDAGGRVSGEMVSLLAGELGGLIAGDIAVDIVDEIDVPVRVHVRSNQRGFIGSIGHNIGRAFGGLMASVMWLLALSALGFVVVYFFDSGGLPGGGARGRRSSAGTAIRLDGQVQAEAGELVSLRVQRTPLPPRTVRDRVRAVPVRRDAGIRARPDVLCGRCHDLGGGDLRVRSDHPHTRRRS